MFVTIVLIGLITVSLLVLLVLGLHRYQLTIAQSNADNHSPLPPLDDIVLDRNLPDLSLDSEVESAGDGTTMVENATLTKPDSEIGPETNDEDTEIIESQPEQAVSPLPDDHADSDNAEAGEATGEATAGAAGECITETVAIAEFQEDEQLPSSSEQDFNDTRANSDNWQEQVATLKKQDRLEEALELCRQEFPLWSAYQQASLIHRARIKRQIQDGSDVSKELDALYRVAAEASFLHDRVKGLPNLSLAQLKLLDLSPVTELDMPYHEIGYTELRLIKKTDIKLLLEKWGKPASHLRPRTIHSETWQKLCSDTQSTLF